MLKATVLCRLLTIIAAACGPALAATATWDQRLADPPADARILKIIHNWPDQPEAQDRLIARLKAQGFGGVVCNVSFNEYLESEARWQAFVRAVNEARKAGLAMWLYDEKGYPSGNAGGITLRDRPEWEARGLLVADRQSTGGTVELDLPPGKIVLVGAFPVRQGGIELTGKVDLAAHVRDGKLSWQAPAGHWHILAITEDRLYEGTHAEGNLHARMPYPNLLLAEPTARFIDVTYGGYARYLGKDLGRYFMASFTDEPSLMSVFLRPMPYRPLPWASNLQPEFNRRRGYRLDVAMLPALVADAGAAGRKFRHDFWLTVGELVSENYFGQIQTRCRELGIPSGGHLLMEENIATHVPLYGDFFRCIRRLDAPSIDCLTSLPPQVPWYIARLLSSAAELEGRPLVMSETSDHAQHWRPEGDQRPRRQVTEAEIRGTCNRQIVAGVNCITSYYSFSGLTDEQLRRLNEWIGRCSTALRGGHQVADVAVLYPSESLWTSFVPSRHWARESAAALRIDNVYRVAAESLFASRRDFTFVDSRALIDAKVEPGSLVHGPLRWQVVVLPGADTMPLAAWENLARFVQRGGVVIALGALPLNSESQFPSPRVAAIADEIFGKDAVATALQPRSSPNAAGGMGIYLPHGLESLLPQVLSGLLEPDVTVTDANSPIRVTHRRIEGRDVCFVINDSPNPWSGQIAFAAAGEGERWDPATGRREPAVSSDVSNLRLEPYGAAIYRFASARPRQRRAVSGAALPGLSLKTLPHVEPTPPHGQYVAAQLSRDSDRSTPGAPVWSAAAELTRSQVDTFLFVQFHYAPALDLSDADCLVIDTWVPEGQATPNQILLIIREQDGGDFIAETGRSLATAGHERSFVPLNRLQLAGWSKDADGILDPRKVADVRIGWGGYLGTQGEKIAFQVALPQAGRIVGREPKP